MQENLPMDYSTIYGRKESEKYGAKNIMIPEALAKTLLSLLCHVLFASVQSSVRLLECNWQRLYRESALTRDASTTLHYQFNTK